MAWIINIGVQTNKVAGGIGPAGKAVDAAVVASPAAVHVIAVAITVARSMVRTAGRICQRAEVVVKGMILLHHDDDVLNLVQVTFCEGRTGRRKSQRQRQDRGKNS